MDDWIDQKIKNILSDLNRAHGVSEQFYAKELKMGENVVAIDFFAMALAFDNEEKLLAELELALSDKFPERYDKTQKEYLQKRTIKLTQNIRAWEHRQIPKVY